MPKLILSILLMLYFATRLPLTISEARPALSALAKRGNGLMRAGDHAQAEQLFREGLAISRQQADWKYVSGFLTSLGVLRVNQSRYRQALELFLESQFAASQVRAAREQGLAAANIGVIYSRLGDWQKAHATIMEAIRKLPAADLPNTLHLNLANYESRLGRFGAADHYYRESIEHSERLGIGALVAAGWEHWGLSFLDRGELEPAENCLLESYRLHRTAKRPEAAQIHYGLARLALAKGDLDEARRRAAQYLAAARQQPLLYPVWEAYRITAEIEKRAGNLAGAYEAYLKGVDWARQSRAERLPSAQLMATAESALQSLYLGLIQAAWELHEQRPDPGLLLTALESAEEGRHAALVENSALLRDDYWQALDSFQRIQARRLTGDTGDLAAKAGTLRAQLIELESAAGLRTPSADTPRQLIARARAGLAPDEAVLVFRTGERRSYVWRLTRTSVELCALEGEAVLRGQVAQFREEAQSGQGGRSETGKKLFSQIFGDFSLPESTYLRWTLVPDGSLHELPFAALPWPTGRKAGTYLIEHRTLRLAPSLATLATPSGDRSRGPTFAGIADAIYNSADPRLSPLPERADILGLFRQARRGGFELARLPGSQAELDAAVRVLKPLNPILLTGPRVSRQAFLSLLDRQASTIHLATHVVPEPGEPRHALIALGLNPQTRDQELVGADEINGRRHGANLVVMSGCGSGRGQALPGAGLMSLTRAWILSGATAVVASHWPVTDHAGALFERFYRHAQLAAAGPHERQANDWAQALQRAQIESIHDRVPASVWAAYFLTGRN